MEKKIRNLLSPSLSRLKNNYKVYDIVSKYRGNICTILYILTHKRTGQQFIFGINHASENARRNSLDDLGKYSQAQYGIQRFFYFENNTMYPDINEYMKHLVEVGEHG